MLSPKIRKSEEFLFQQMKALIKVARGLNLRYFPSKVKKHRDSDWSLCFFAYEKNYISRNNDDLGLTFHFLPRYGTIRATSDRKIWNSRFITPLTFFTHALVYSFAFGLPFILRVHIFACGILTAFCRDFFIINLISSENWNYFSLLFWNSSFLIFS